MDAIRILIICILTSVFIYSCILNYNKLVNPIILTATSTKSDGFVKFPSITICPISRANGVPNKTIDELYVQAREELQDTIITAFATIRFDKAKRIPPIDLVNRNNYPLEDGTTWDQVWSTTWIGLSFAQKCYTLSIPGWFKVGLAGHITLTLKAINGAADFLLQTHANGSFVPTAAPKLGNRPIALYGKPIRPYEKAEKLINEASFNLKMISTTKYNMPDSEPCFEDTDDTPQTCLLKTMTKSIGCNLPNSSYTVEEFKPCSNANQTAAYVALLNNITVGDSTTSMNTIGKNCQYPCKRDEYDLVKIEDSLVDCLEDPDDPEFCHNQLNVNLRLYDGTWTVLIENPIYDRSNFVADVGGLMGLLLGASVLTLYDVAQTLTRKYVWNKAK